MNLFRSKTIHIIILSIAVLTFISMFIPIFAPVEIPPGTYEEQQEFIATNPRNYLAYLYYYHYQFNYSGSRDLTIFPYAVIVAITFLNIVIISILSLFHFMSNKKLLGGVLYIILCFVGFSFALLKNYSFFSTKLHALFPIISCLIILISSTIFIISNSINKTSIKD